MAREKQNPKKLEWIGSGFTLLSFFLLSIGICSGQTIYTVNSSEDSEDVDLADLHCADENGNCSLRAAIENANKTSAKDKIHFNIPGHGPFEIILLKNLPAITEPLELDATTQPYFSLENPKIILNGKKIPLVSNYIELSNTPTGFYLADNSGGSIIKGFVIGGFGYTNDAASRKDMIYFVGTGILIETEGNSIQSNYIGLSGDGKTNFSNIFGIGIHASNNLIGGDERETRNIISANWRSGILSYSKNLIKGNFIGTDAGGINALGNRSGITLVVHSENNIIEQNLISGNKHGINIIGNKNYIYNNRIGTNFKGTESLPNETGILLQDALENIIGTGNLISGNTIGILLSSRSFSETQKNYILGNFIGTDITGKMSIPNKTGIYIRGSSNNIIGGKRIHHKNLISGNKGAGLSFSAANGNAVIGNFIGSDVSGKKAVPNSIGIEFSGEPGKNPSCDNLIYENLISGNMGDGIKLNFATGNSLYRNFIGTAHDGINALSNTGNGIILGQEVTKNCIGSNNPLNSNIIAYNRGNGIFITTVPNNEAKFLTNQILPNDIFSNKSFNISLKNQEQQEGMKSRK